MIKFFFCAALLVCARPCPAEAAADSEDQDIYYAPADAQDATATVQAGATAAVGSFYSRAVLKAFAWGQPSEPLLGVEVFLGGQFLGKTPLLLSEFLVSKPGYALTARLNGYEEASRPNFAVPQEGEIRVALLDKGAASWYSTPAWVLGLGLIAGSVAAYSNNSNTLGTTLLCSGVGLVTLVQGIVHFLHMPALRRDVQAYNDQAGAAP